jgi:hypothetical protein
MPSGRTVRARAHRLSIVIASLASSAGALRAAAEERPSIALEWVAPSPSQCPTKGTVVAEVARMIGPDVTPNPKASARVVVERVDAARWKGTVTLVTEDGTSVKSFVGASCDAVAAAAAIIVAVGIGAAPAEPTSSSPAPPAPSPAPSPPASAASPAALLVSPPPEPASTAEESSPPRGLDSHLTASLLAAVDQGSLPSADVGGVLSLGWLGVVGRTRLRLEAEASAWAPETARLRSDPTQGAQLLLLTFGARGCYARAFGALELGPCVGYEVDVLQATGFSPETALDGAGVWSSLRAGLAGSWSLSKRFALRLSADAGATVARPKFAVEGPIDAKPLTLFTPDPLTLRASLGVVVRFF